MYIAGNYIFSGVVDSSTRGRIYPFLDLRTVRLRRVWGGGAFRANGAADLSCIPRRAKSGRNNRRWKSRLYSDGAR